MTNKSFKKVEKIIDGLRQHKDTEAVGLLEEVGTNSSLDCVREMTSRALIKRNEPESLQIVIGHKGKGIHDMSTIVAMSAINEILALKDKTFASQVLEETVNSHEDEAVRDNARSVRALLALS